MTIQTLYATQGGGTAVYDRDSLGYRFVTTPGWGLYKTDDQVPEEWSVASIGTISTGPVEDMETTERDGYEAGYANKQDPNPFIAGTHYNEVWAAGRARGDAERLALDEVSP